MLVLIVGCTGLVVLAEEGSGNCVENTFGAELCGQDAVNSCKDQTADARQLRREERKDQSEAISDARADAREFGDSEAEAESQAREDFAPTKKTASDRRSDKICTDLLEAEGE